MFNKYFAIIRENEFLFRVNDQPDIIEYSYEDIEKYPNVPFYVFLFDDMDRHKEVRRSITDSIVGSGKIKSKILRAEVYFAIPDDTMGFENKGLEEFALTALGARNVYLVNECRAITVEDPTYICISRSCRIITLSYIKDRKIKSQKFLKNDDYSLEEIRNNIHNLHEDCRYTSLKIYINGNNLSKYSQLGKAVSHVEILNNLYNATTNKRMFKN